MSIREENEKRFLLPLISKLYSNEDVVIEDTSLLREVEGLRTKDFYALFNNKAFLKFGSDKLQAVLQESHGKFCDEYGLYPARVVLDNLITDDYVSGEYNPIANEILFNESYLGFLANEGMNVELNTLRNLLELSAEKLQYDNFLSAYQMTALNDLDLLASLNTVSKFAIKGYERDMGEYRENNGLNLQRYDIHQTALEEMVRLYKKGYLPKNSETKNFLKNAIDEYKNIPDEYILSETMRETALVKTKLQNNFDGEKTRNILNMYSRVDMDEVLNTIKTRNKCLKDFASNLDGRDYDEGK